MQFLTIETLMTHCKADGDETTQLETYGDAAEASAVSIMNRNLYATEEDLVTARANARVALATAAIEYVDAVVAAGTDQDALDLAEHAYAQARIAAWRDGTAILINSEIIGAMLMHAAHLWTNRTDAVTGQYGAATAVPMNSAWVYERYRWREGAFR